MILTCVEIDEIDSPGMPNTSFKPSFLLPSVRLIETSSVLNVPVSVIGTFEPNITASASA